MPGGHEVSHFEKVLKTSFQHGSHAIFNIIMSLKKDEELCRHVLNLSILLLFHKRYFIHIQKSVTLTKRAQYQDLEPVAPQPPLISSFTHILFISK